MEDAEYTISARAFDGEDYSEIDEVSVTVKNEKENEKPTVSITKPEDAEEISGIYRIKGTASDEDGEIEKIEVKIENWEDAKGTTSWYFDWDTTEVLSGKYTISARAFDGAHYSKICSVNVTVKNEKENQKPKAYIDSIEPNPAIEGEIVRFEGSGKDEDGEIVKYSWDSSLDGFLSKKSSFSRDDLSVGKHEISFKVKDDSGEWSEIVTEILIIKAKEEEKFLPDLSISASDISFSENNPKEGETIFINATIHNIGNKKGEAIVEFYDGNPDSDGIFIDSVSISIEVAETEIVSIEWKTTAGEHEIFVKITNSKPKEEETSNNLASRKITVEKTESKEDDDFPIFLGNFTNFYCYCCNFRFCNLSKETI